MLRQFFILLLFTLAIHGQEEDPVALALKELEAAPPTTESLANTVPLLADPAGRNRIRNALLALDPFPSADMVSLLKAPALAVRLGSLEILEEMAGGDFGYNPWSSPEAPGNEGPLARWQQWSGEDPSTAEKNDLFGEEQRRGYLRDLLGNDADKSSRARRMLEADGLGAVGFLETFLSSSPALPAGSRAQVREAQYQIVLSRPLGPQAASTARHLAFGSRDQTLAALGTLRNVGLVGLPILRDFLSHSDPLVRETAIDAMLSAGGAQALPVVGPVLMAETDVNVIHGALRRLKEISGDESLKIALSFLNHEDEDLLVSAIQACQKLSGGDQGSPFASSSSTKVDDKLKTEVQEAVIKALDDPRWRVRTAALEYVNGCKVAAAKDRCVELLSDPDEFVRFSAIKAAASLRAEGTAEKLKEIFLTDPGMVGPVFEGYAALGQQPDGEMTGKLTDYPPDARLAAIRAAESDPKLTPVVLRLASDDDLDVSCAAIRYLSADDDRVKTSEVATVLVAALRSGIPEKRTATLDRLVLPKSKSAIDPELLKVVAKFSNNTSTTLDPLYNSLLKAAGQQSPADQTPSVEVLPGAQGELRKELEKIASGDSPDSFRAALCLAKSGETSGLTPLITQLPTLSTAQRAAIAEQLYEPSRKEALELLKRLVRDPVEEIRASAAESALSNSDAPAFLAMVLEEISRPGAKLQPYQIYSYRFESAARNQRSGKALRDWAIAQIRDAQGTDATRILSLIGLRQGFPSSAKEPTLRLAKSSPSQWVRRAAWHALGTSKSSAFNSNLDTLASDPSAQVRMVLPAIAGRMSAAWQHRFDDTHSTRDSSWSYDRNPRPLASEAHILLQKLSASDPSPEVRFEAYFALLSHGKTIDTTAFANLIPQQPEEVDASYRIADWMGDNITKLGPGLAPIAAALDTSKIGSNDFQRVISMIAPKTSEGPGFASFAALAEASQVEGSAPQQIVAPTDETDPERPERESLKLVFFFKPGCDECEKASQLLHTLKRDFPLLEIEEHNILEPRGTELNQALCSRFAVPTMKHTLSPALFTQAGFLVREDIQPQALGKLLASTMDEAQDDGWSKIAEPEIAAAREQVEERFEALTLPVVITAGLIDGVNPCAFATIIFFLSYLQIARRTPKEMLMVGVAFISAVFIAYFLAGLVLHKVLAQLTGTISGIKPILDWAFGGLALFAAFLSFRDAMKARAGKLDEMTLQLPGFLKKRIKGVIRTGTRARRFVIAAFVAGIIISFLELACTGQVYAPIIYSIQQGKADAVAWLLAYNLAFIVPLIVIFGLAFTGVSSNALIAFQTRHTFAVKIALGLVFVALAVVIFFGSKFLHS